MVQQSDIAGENQASEQADEENNGERINYDQPWLASFARPALISIMAASLSITFMSLVHHFVPTLSPLYFQAAVVLSVIAALIGSISTAMLAQPSRRLWRGATVRWAEIVLLLLTARLVTWLVVGNWPTVRSLMTAPIATLLDGPFLAVAFSLTMAWIFATVMSRDLLQMALQPDELYLLEHSSDHFRDTSRAGYTDRMSVLRGFVARWVGGGLVLVLLAAGQQLGQPGKGLFALTRQNIAFGVIAAIVIYFLAGLILISQGQLAVLRSRWTMDRVPNSQNIMRNWPIYVLAVIVVVGLVSALMPFGGTFRLAQIISAILGFIYLAAFTFIRILAVIFFLFLSLFSGGEEQEAPPPPPPPAEFAPPPPPPASPPGFEYFGSAIFWIITALLLGYAAYIYFSGRGVQFGRVIWFLRMLKERWLAIWGAYHTWQTERIAALTNSSGNGSSETRRSFWSRFQRTKLDPTAQVRYFYLTLLERAGQSGIPRSEAETPYQYETRLVRALNESVKQEKEDEELVVDKEPEPDIDRDMDRDMEQLTAAFVKARYTSTAIAGDDLPHLQQLWERLLAILKGH